MPRHLAPGVYIEEITSKAHAIERASTSTTAFVGITQRNSLAADRFDPDKVTAFTSFRDYLGRFGPVLSSGDDMGLAVQAFFLNGGDRCYVFPLSNNSSTASVLLGGMRITANGDGPWGNRLYVRISETDQESAVFNLEIGTRNNTGVFYANEKYASLSLQASSENFVGNVLSRQSALVSADIDDTSTLPQATDIEGIALQGGSQSSPSPSDFRDFYNRSLIKVQDVSIIVLPGQVWAADGSGNEIISATLTHCDDTQSSVVIIDLPKDAELTNARHVERMALPASSYSVLYYPWVGMNNSLYSSSANPTISKKIYLAPSAIAAGMWAKIDKQRGVWKTPAGIEAQLTGSVSLRFRVDSHVQEEISPPGINCIRDMGLRVGRVLWGARTLANTRGIDMRYIAVRRTTIMIKESIDNGTDWVIFEPNDPRLWSSLKSSIENFLFELFRSGALQGAKAEEAYFVHCGLGDTMTQSDLDNMRVVVNVGFALLKPAEFTVIKIEKRAGV
ncbi:MAG: phage tail sheath family protein [Proteobacteria bacterium]|nr:phage tail sheath family protein [Pseudomonadota bacterium]